MSAKNGDKSRYQINRKRRVLRRVKTRALRQALKDQQPPKAADGGRTE